MDSLEPAETLESAMEVLERLHLKLQLEAGSLPPGSHVARTLIDLTEELTTVTGRLRRVLDRSGVGVAMSSSNGV